MKLQELPKEIQEQLARERAQLSKRQRNTAYDVLLYNREGTRYFYAHRVSQSWSDDKGNYMPFGGGSFWAIRYGCVQFTKYKNPVGETDYMLCDGKQYGRSANGTDIPKRLDTKKEVIALVREIGIFTI